MAGEKFKKVQTGAPLEIPSATWNAMLDAARAHVERQHDQGVDAEFLFRQAGIIKVRNNSGADQPRFSVLGIDTPIISPEDNEREFKNQAAINAKTPSIDDHLGKFVVLLDPITENKIGRAWCSGICPAKINVDKEWHAELVQLYGKTFSTHLNQQIKKAQSWLKQRPDDPDLLLALGRLCAQDKNWANAQAHLDHCSQLKPSAEVYGELAQLMLLTNRQEDAISYFQKGMAPQVSSTTIVVSGQTN